ncbi:hypothetical protein [Nocardia lasii]|uniref:CsbD family protein n=1 Tax=Nocardia lasii TaxID=1616107 RepID=A0ABW1JK96_9NOCA
MSDTDNTTGKVKAEGEKIEADAKKAAHDVKEAADRAAGKVKDAFKQDDKK